MVPVQLCTDTFRAYRMGFSVFCTSTRRYLFRQEGWKIVFSFFGFLFFSLWDLLQKRRTERLRMASNIASCRRWSVVCQHVCRSAKTTCTDVAASSCSLPLPINCNAISGNLHRLPHACTVAVRNAAPPESDNFCSKLFPSL